MTTIGPGGNGPIGPADGGGAVDGVEGPDGAVAADAAEPALEPGAAGDADPLTRLAADLDAGRISPEQAMAELIDGSLAGLPPEEQAEVRRLMEDLVASDPYLGGLLGGTGTG